MKAIHCTIICSLVYMIILSDVFATSSKDDILAGEIANNMQYGDINQGHLIPNILSIIDDVCNMNTDDKAFADKQVRDTLTQIGLTLTKSTAEEYYLMYQQWHISAEKYNQMRDYCTYKTAAYQLQYHFYQVQQGSAFATNPIRTSFVRRTEYFKQLSILNQYDVPLVIQPYLKIEVSNKSEVLKYHPITKSVASQMTSLYRGIVAHAINNLLNDRIITIKDVEQLGTEIIFNYVTQCTDLRGFTKVLISKRNDIVVNISLDNITFNVNVCEDQSFLTNFDQHIKDLVYHELAHYIYYIKDGTHSNFENICWKNGKQTCSNAGFVTEYARTAAEEDYAEHFQYWYQNKPTKSNSIIAEKINYFNNIYGKRK